MPDDSSQLGGPTRGDHVKSGGAGVGGGLLAGCAGQSGSGSTPGSTRTGADTGTNPGSAETGAGADAVGVEVPSERDAGVHHVDPLRAVDGLDGDI